MTSIIDNESKALNFEYIVYQLNIKRTELKISDDSTFTKLRLQKLLFLISTINATRENKGLLDYFTKFYALPYGPVESDIYNAMNTQKFENIKFEGNKCFLDDLNDSRFKTLDNSYKYLVENSIEDLAKKRPIKEYLTMSVFDLVNITHQWTVWKVAMTIAKMLDSGSEPMSPNDIIDSRIKAY